MTLLAATSASRVVNGGHLRWPRATTSVLRATLKASAWREAAVDVSGAGNKGFGAFAAEAIAAGDYVGPYIGTITTREETRVRYNATTYMEATLIGDYLFRVDDTFSIDAQNSTHFSRYFNHAEHGNLEVDVDSENTRVNFFAARDIAAGEELCFDYGTGYWMYRPQPTPESDSRNFSHPIYRERKPELSLQHPPPVGTRLPLVPLTAPELQAALAMPEDESRAALLRCLDFFGAVRTADGTIRMPPLIDVDEVAPTQAANEIDHAALQTAATACIARAVLDPADASGRLARELTSWVAENDAELQLIRRWRERVPRAASARRDAVALVAYLLWKNPLGHEVTQPLTRDECDALVGDALGALGDAGRDPSTLIATLADHAPEQHVADLVTMVERWYTCGDGCRVASEWPPQLEGAVPQHLSAIWDRVPRLVEYGLL